MIEEIYQIMKNEIPLIIFNIQNELLIFRLTQN